MTNVITFTPRPTSTVPMVVPPAADLILRAHLEEAAQTALDAADKIIAALDRIKDEGGLPKCGDTHRSPQDSQDDPTFEAMLAHAGQTVTLHEPIILSEPRALADPVEREVAPELQGVAEARPIIVPEPLRWYGAGNVISAAGIALLSLVTRG